MTTETIERTPAEKRKATAAELVKKIERERLQLQTRKHEAADSIERLQHEIVTRERAGTDPDIKALPRLRQQRLEQQQILEDLDRILPTFERDLVPARAELRVAEIVCHADRYNALVMKQCALTEVISEAITTIVETLKVKEGLAQQQYNIQMGDIGWLHPGSSPAGVRLAFLQELTKRLEDKDSKPNYFFNIAQIDWSCRPMIENGDLRPIE